LIKYVINSIVIAVKVSLFGDGMGQLAVTGASGEMGLLTQCDTETSRLCRSVHLQASGDGKTVVLVEVDERKVGIQREYRFEVTAGELVALIRAEGIKLRAELPGENHVRPADNS
jgi:hypothetical protein